MLPDLASALKLFDETTATLSARLARMDEVLSAKQQELVATNRHLSEKVAELDRLSRWLNLVMGAVASGVFAVDRDGVITTCNAAAETGLRPAIADPIGASIAAAFPDSPLVRVAAGALETASYERVVSERSGARRIHAATATALRAGDGALIGAVEVFDDVTEVRRLRESVERADRLKQLGEMAAGVAHEIRNPLNGIEGFASLLARDLPAGDHRRRYADLVVEGVRTLNRTVSGLLEFTRPRRLERRDCAPAALAESCLDLVRAELALTSESEMPDATLELVVRWPTQTPVNVDPIQIKQVLLNLVQNAVHAAVAERAAGSARVVVMVEPASAADGAPAIAWRVDDNGPGVPTDERQRIFTPFYTTKDHGTGLGLAVSHAIVGLHGGALSVDDAPLGGARFSVVVPVA